MISIRFYYGNISIDIQENESDVKKIFADYLV